MEFLIENNHIKTTDNRIVMHEWETPIMEKMSNWICNNGGDILEIGFGMGIASNFIQKNKINSHTICESNPLIIEKLYKWSENKPNVVIIEGDWFEKKEMFKKYDGILFDTYNDKNSIKFKYLLNDICKLNCRFTWWNNMSKKYDEYNLNTTFFDVIDVNPPDNDYFNHKKYFIPKYIYNGY